MIDAAIEMLAKENSEEARNVQAEYAATIALATNPFQPQAGSEHDRLRVKAIAAQGRVLAELRCDGRIDDDAFHRLEEELDWAELNAAAPGQFELLST
jgi:hypothetical protein